MRQERLSKLLDISIGRTPSRSESSYWGKGHRWVSIRDMNSKVVTETKEQITDRAVRDARCKVVKKGTLLFSFKLTIGKMAFAGCDLFTNEAIAAFAIKDEKELHPEFLYYALQLATYSGSNQAVMGKTLNSKSLAEIEIPVPPLDDQIRIAHLLSKVEGLIALRKQHLQQLDDLLKSVFLEMFGDPMSNSKKWPDSGLGDALTFLQYGPRFYNESYSVDGIRIVRITDLSESGDLEFSEMPRLDVTSEEKDKFLLKPGDLIFARTGATVGKVAIIGPNDPPAIAGAYFIVMRFQPTLLPLYVRFVLTSSSVRAAIADRSRQAAQPNFSGPGLRKLPMPRPPIELQRDFAEIFEAVADLKVRYRRSLAGLQDLYGGLSQHALRGELDLSRVTLPAVPAVGVSPVAAAVPAPTTIPVIQLPETNLLSPALQDRAQLPLLLRFWLEVYRAQSGSAAFSVERFIAAAQTRLAKLHPDNDFELGASDYEHIKAWVFEALGVGALTQAFDDAVNRIELKAAAESSPA